MRRSDFDHVIAAAANATGEDEFVVIGSQAVLGPFPDAPEALLRSLEADIYPLADPRKSDLIDGALGDGSRFHEAHGYYAHGVGPETAKAPRGWRDRLLRVEIPPKVASQRNPVAWCLEPHDLVLAKCVAGRERDWEFARQMLRAEYVTGSELLGRVESLPIDEQARARIRSMLSGAIDATTAAPG